MKFNVNGKVVNLDQEYYTREQVIQLIEEHNCVTDYYDLDFKSSSMFLMSLSYLKSNHTLFSGALEDHIEMKQGEDNFWDTLYALKPGTYNFNFNSIVFNSSEDEASDVDTAITMYAQMQKDYLMTKTVNEDLGMIKDAIESGYANNSEEVPQEVATLLNEIASCENNIVFHIHATNYLATDGYWVELRNSQNEAVSCLWAFYMMA